MKLSKDTIDIIGAIQRINAGSTVSGICFQQGNIIKARKQSTRMPVIRAEIEEEWPQDFAIYDIKKFLSMFTLFDDPDLAFDSDGIIFSDDRKKAKIKFAQAFLIEEEGFYQQDIAMPSKDIEFVLSKDDFNSIKKAAVIFGAPDIAICGDGTSISITTSNGINSSSDVLSIKVGETTKNFNLILPLENLQFMQKEYKVTASFKGLLEFDGDNIKYWVTFTDKSRIK